jgi:Nuclease-related domain
MKEDILEQIVDEYLMHRGYFTMHNVKFKPDRTHPEFVTKQDSVASDIDVIAVHPKLTGPERVIVVSCKSWQEGFDPLGFIKAIESNGKWAGRDAWRVVRELCSPKWTSAFFMAIEAATGTSSFTYWTAVTSLTKGRDKATWENNATFVDAMRGNPIRIVAFADMLDEVWDQLSTTPAATDLGRTVQLIKASRWLESKIHSTRT